MYENEEDKDFSMDEELEIEEIEEQDLPNITQLDAES
jgi:hypothetical protein